MKFITRILFFLALSFDASSQIPAVDVLATAMNKIIAGGKSNYNGLKADNGTVTPYDTIYDSTIALEGTGPHFISYSTSKSIIYIVPIIMPDDAQTAEIDELARLWDQQITTAFGKDFTREEVFINDDERVGTKWVYRPVQELGYQIRVELMSLWWEEDDTDELDIYIWKLN